MTRWQLDPLPALDGYTVEWVSPARMILSRRHRLYEISSPGDTPRPLARFPVPAWSAVATALRPVQRLLRAFFYNVLELPDGGLFLTYGRRLGAWRDGSFEPIGAPPRSFRVLRGACALGDDGCVYLGEYFANAERGDVRVYRWAPGMSTIEEVHRFPPRAARHVHGIYRDPTDGSLWCLTGDEESECRFLRTRDGFATLEEVGGGDETWRCVSAQFTEKAIYYASDAEFRPNHVHRLDRTTGRRDELGPIDGPVYYSHAVGDDLFFAVSAELCPSQQGRSATLWHVDTASGRLGRVRSFEKDRLPLRYFLAGTLFFPRGPGRGRESFVHAVALAGADDRTFSLRARADAP